MPFSALSKDGNILIIAEVGQNHQGRIDIALKYVKKFASLGAHAIKFQTRNNSFLFDSSVYNMSYNSENSFGKTYGEHRESLEFSPSELRILKETCKDEGVFFIVTPFDEKSLELCIDVGVDILKIASFDAGNLPFLHLAGKTGLPIVMSTGGASLEQIGASLHTLESYHSDIALLHCVSKYPCPAEEVNIGKIQKLASIYPNITLGISDHFNGILTGPLAYTQGARVFEKHVTFDRSSKGTDHAFSLEPDGFRRYVRDINRCPILFMNKSDDELGNEPVFKRLGKSLVCRKEIRCGSKILPEHLSGLIINPQGIPVRESNKVIGQIANVTIVEGTLIKWGMLV